MRQHKESQEKNKQSNEASAKQIPGQKLRHLQQGHPWHISQPHWI